MQASGTTGRIVAALAVLIALGVAGVGSWVAAAGERQGAETDLRESPMAARPTQGAASVQPSPPRLPGPDVTREEETPEPSSGWHLLGSKELRQRSGRTPRGFLRHRIIHFTFDDGPDLETTPELLDALEEYGVRATFFVVGRQLLGPRSQARRALLQRIEEEGHTVAVHTHSHQDLRRQSSEQITADLERVEQMLEATLGHRPGLFRPPYGGRSRRSDALLRERGYAQVLWNIAPEAPGPLRADNLLRNFRVALNRQDRHHRGPGGIVLLHDPNAASVEAFTLMMEELRERNCELLGSADEELWDVASDLRPFLLHDGELPADVVATRQAVARAEAATYCADGS